MSTPISSVSPLSSSNQVFGNPPKVLTVAQAKARLEGGEDIRRLVIKDSAANIQSGFADLKGWADDKILKGIQVQDGGEVTLRIADLEVKNADNRRSEEKATMQVLRALDRATVKVADVATEVKDGLDELKLYQRRLDAMTVVPTSDMGTPADDSDDTSAAPVISLTASEFKSNQRLLGKIQGAVVEVELAGNYADYSIKARSAGKMSITSRSQDVRLTGEGAHLLKFIGDGRRVVASSGDTRIDALIEVGKKNLWSASGLSGTLAVNSSASNAEAADRYQLLPGVYALDDNTSSSDPLSLTYGFHADASTVPNADNKFFQAMTDVQKAVVRDAFTYLGGLINVSFTEAETLNADSTNIQFGTNEQGKVSAGYAYMPREGVATTQVMLANDVSYNSFSFLTDDDGDASNGFQLKASESGTLRASAGWMTLVHEIGHALGLKHPGNYNAGGGGASPPYLPKLLDSNQWTLMSYSRAPSASALDGGASSSMNPQTAMIYDIAALQFMYGKASDSADDVLSDYQKTTFTQDWRGMQTLWSGSSMTLDASARSNRMILDTRGGSFSSIDRFNDVGLALGAKYGSVLAGSGNDLIYAANYSLSVNGGDGDDMVILDGKASDWKFNDGSGADDLPTGDLNDTITLAGNGTLTRTVNGEAVAIAVTNVEKVKFYDAARLAGTHSAADFDRMV